MYPKDTGSDDSGTAHSSEAGGVQTDSGMRRSIFQNPAPSTSSSNSSSTMTSSSENSSNNLNITVAPFTGGPFEVKVSKMDSVDELKKVIARRLKVSKERIYLLYRESELIEGSVSTNLLVDGSTVTLLPRAETGLISPKPEQSVMQALESLNEQQVNDFLSGAAPLNLTMRLGDHMMLIQLQLSTVNQASSSRRKSTIQISSSSPPPYPTPPPSAPSSPSSSEPSTSSNSHQSSSNTQSSKKVKVPLLSPGGLYTAPPKSSSSSHRSQSQHPESYSRKTSASSESGEPPSKKPKLDTKALAEASKNLTQTLKQLSSEVLTTRPETGETSTSTSSSSQIPKKQETSASNSGQSTSSNSERPSAPSSGASSSSGNSSSSSSGHSRHSRKRHSGRGAIIESMHHHGKGVYSGTFSGTLNPALQDEHGQPKRDITTIVHILNDLLCAQYKAYSGSGSSHRSSRHHRHHHHHHHSHHHHSKNKSSQHTDPKTTIFDAEARAANEKQRQEEQLNLTRHKVETLRKIMEERRAKREARRQAAAAGRSASSSPASYSTAWSVSEAKDCDKADQEQEQVFLSPEPEPVTA